YHVIIKHHGNRACSGGNNSTSPHEHRRDITEVNLLLIRFSPTSLQFRLDLESNIPHRVHPPEHVYPEIIHIITIGRMVIIVTYPSSRREELVPAIPDLGRNINTGIIPEGHPTRAA